MHDLVVSEKHDGLIGLPIFAAFSVSDSAAIWPVAETGLGTAPVSPLIFEDSFDLELHLARTFINVRTPDGFLQ